MYLKKAMAQQCTFLSSLSDLDNDSDDGHSSSPSSDNEFERKREDKLIGLCFFTDSTHGDSCTMAVDFEVKASKGNLVAELDTMNDILMSQDKLVKRAAHERKEYKDKLKIALKELEAAKKCVV